MMDKTPKSKLFGFRRSGRSFEQSSPSNSRSISKTEVIDLETLPISETAIPTSPAVNRVNTANQLSSGQCSPQFVVGWNDGPESDDLYMYSPIRAPVLRNIRRCPDSNTFKAPKRNPKDNKEDILQCIHWSKNLFETTNRDKEDVPDNEKVSADEQKKEDAEILPDDKVTENQTRTKDVQIDILDDSADEMMILCSQAVEQNLPVSRHPPVAPVSASIPRKRPITPDDHSRKKYKVDPASNANKEEHKAASTSVNLNSNSKKCNHSNFKIPTSKQDTKTKVSSKVPENNSVQNQDLFEALLNDDEDDLFGSFDFHSIDKKLQTQNKGVSSKSVSSHANLGVTKLNDNRNSTAKPVPKYTKEQIEQRRLEAKKRLLFNKKYKSL